MGPRYSPSKLFTFQYLLPRKIDVGLETNVVAGETPSFSAVASTNGLNDEPGWRSPCTARLNWLVWELRPPEIATTPPFMGLIATSAACGPVVLGSHLSIASRASFCRPRSI